MPAELHWLALWPTQPTSTYSEYQTSHEHWHKYGELDGSHVRLDGQTHTHTCHANVNVRWSENSANRDMTHADAIGER